ncbi:MAG: hypothetical protein ACTSQQ_08130, partial [Candidatus Helarchaeota archaeon]
LHEAIVIYFGESAGNIEDTIRYEIYPTPIFRCRKCGWQGIYADLPVEEKKIKINTVSDVIWEQNTLLNPTLRKVSEICPNCGSVRLNRKKYYHRGRDLYIIGTHNDIAKLGTVVDPVIPHRVNGLINALWSYFISEKVKFRPLWRVDLAIQFGRLLL